ncbi:MAG: hypothetical protein PHF67_05460, partial [Candidatus Nanoarchaeia archaeon]|nr:hypothetical protein [Candidatus Nanoarchaeia archaeon]
MDEENRKLNKRKEELKKAIEVTKQDKKNIINIVQKLLSQLNSRAIDRKEYDEKLAKALGNRTSEQWTKYYDDYLDYYDYQLKLSDKLIKEKGSEKLKNVVKPGLRIVMIFAIIGILISLFFILKPAFSDISKNGA